MASWNPFCFEKIAMQDDICEYVMKVGMYWCVGLQDEGGRWELILCNAEG